jgi:hypothetical protein
VPPIRRQYVLQPCCGSVAPHNLYKHHYHVACRFFISFTYIFVVVRGRRCWITVRHSNFMHICDTLIPASVTLTAVPQISSITSISVHYKQTLNCKTRHKNISIDRLSYWSIEMLHETSAWQKYFNSMLLLEPNEQNCFIGDTAENKLPMNWRKEVN